jgi:HlyD family secretion protein
MANSKGKRTRKVLIFSSIALVLITLTLLAIFRKRQVTIKVQTERISRRNMTELVVANGRIQPVLQVVINPEVSGEIIELPVKEGQPVKKGDLLLRIKPDNYRASRNSAHASFQSALASKNLAQANLTKAEIELNRFDRLLKNKLVSDSQYLDVKTTLDVMKATFETTCHQADQAKAALAKADDDLAKTTIYSPIAGTVTKLKSQTGERVVGTALMAGTEIMTIADLTEMEARVDIGEVDIVLIQLGQTARLEVDAFGDRKFTGRVTEIANASKNSAQPAAQQQQQQQQQEATRFEVKIHLTDKEQFRPGMSVTSEIETRYRTNVLAIPIQSVTTRAPKGKGKGTDQKAAEKKEETETETKKKEKSSKPVEVVFLANSETVRMVPVKRGISDEEYVEIVEGLQEGQTVISGGYKAINRELEDGKKVVIDNSAEKKEEKK